MPILFGGLRGNALDVRCELQFRGRLPTCAPQLPGKREPLDPWLATYAPSAQRGEQTEMS